MDRLTPTPEQEAVIQQALNSPTGSHLDGSLMSAGKTLIACEILKRKDCQLVLLIAPLNTMGGWKRRIEGQGLTIPFRQIDSTKAGKEALADYEWDKPGVYAIGPELFSRRSWNAASRSGLFNTKVHDAVVLDEAHRGANRKSKTHKSLMGVKAKYRHSMSGTVAGNSFEGAYAPTRWLFPGDTDASFYRWLGTWAATVYDQFAPMQKRVVGEKTPGAYFASLPSYSRIEPRIDVERDEDTVYVQLTKAQRKIYSELERDMVTWIKSNPLTIEFPITLRARLRQATLGTLSVDDAGEVSFPDDCESPKLEALYDLIDNEFEGESALIGTDSAKFAKLATERLNARYGATREWSGRIGQVERQQVKEDFMAERVKYIVAVIPAAAEGLDGFQAGTRNIVMLSRSDNRILNDQFIARVHRTGQQKLVRVRDIVAEDSYDEGILSDQLRAALEMNKVLRGIAPDSITN